MADTTRITVTPPAERVAETALRRPGPVAVLTSGVDDMSRPRGGRVRLAGVRAGGAAARTRASRRFPGGGEGAVPGV
ncbi:hypothetical protein [Streptomyces sp.]|uniref:hypothetical protein n=1 Tax=Streptomyces sp. TaxID=1931 RepID=UPI002811CAC5|nr:hypothetical protein [Streptomyces sp.]